MAMSPDSALDNLARIIQVIEDDPKLHDWFCQLARLAPVERRNEIYRMVHHMRSESRDADLLSSFQMLADDRVFAAARESLSRRS